MATAAVRHSLHPSVPASQNDPARLTIGFSGTS
jgi:hypothetical protein